MTIQACKRTSIRELGGEIWAEITHRVDEEQIDWTTRGVVVDIIMGVLARHEGAVIENDAGLEVEPLENSDQRTIPTESSS